MSAATAAPPEFDKPTTAAAWKKAKTHEVVLPSGVAVEIEIPNLSQMVKTGELPNDLIDAALGAMQKQRVTPDLLLKQADFYTKLVALTVVKPKITEEDVADLPYEDQELLVELATRQRDVDALGHHIAGLHTSKDWRRFRGYDISDEDVEDL
jgi:hypothetical protein